jgi:hypothetical protein
MSIVATPPKARNFGSIGPNRIKTRYLCGPPRGYTFPKTEKLGIHCSKPHQNLGTSADPPCGSIGRKNGECPTQWPKPHKIADVKWTHPCRQGLRAACCRELLVPVAVATRWLHKRQPIGPHWQDGIHWRIQRCVPLADPSVDPQETPPKSGNPVDPCGRSMVWAFQPRVAASSLCQWRWPQDEPTSENPTR